MNNSVREKAYRKLDAYIEESNRRKTPERYAILDAIYDIKGHFSVEQLKEKLNNAHFPVSRATLFNSLKLFQELSIIVRHNFRDGTRYEACMTDEPKCHQICNVCNNENKGSSFKKCNSFVTVSNLALRDSSCFFNASSVISDDALR